MPTPRDSIPSIGGFSDFAIMDLMESYRSVPESDHALRAGSGRVPGGLRAGSGRVPGGLRAG